MSSSTDISPEDGVTIPVSPKQTDPFADPRDDLARLAPPAAPTATVAETAPPKTREGEEIWEMLVPGTVWLKTTVWTRHGQPQDKDLSIGPNQVGRRVRISALDREVNQSVMTSEALDPFRNGMLKRVSEHPDEDEVSRESAQSSDALTAGELAAIYDLPGDEFSARVSGLGEVPLRRLRELAEALDASLSQVELLDDVIASRYRKGGEAQPSLSRLTDEPADGERLT